MRRRAGEEMGAWEVEADEEAIREGEKICCTFFWPYTKSIVEIGVREGD